MFAGSKPKKYAFDWKREEYGNGNVNGWDLKINIERDCKVYVTLFGQSERLYHILLKTFFSKWPRPIYLTCWNKWLEVSDDLRMQCRVRYWSCHSSKKRETWRENRLQCLNQKTTVVNKFLLKFCKETNFYFIDTLKRLKLHHLNKSKLHVNKNGSRILSGIYYKDDKFLSSLYYKGISKKTPSIDHYQI